ncbi:MAG: DUF2791 family P-loop domain-containing protein [Elusimicrobiota bacterium]|nr:DUF2791 family P-loop domain-containing protein [Endomicrobiia bacterium]MCX7942461.1 DUF2791 family P-loop domain-containing protein [Dictyoglomaceae bacterium]MDW8166344.1 DUF2791 family P-loop domain-containing protein [Elusimicrobiota bacterium]
MNKKVFHNLYGEGEIINRRFKGYEYLVLFENGLKKWIRISELKFLDVEKKESLEKNKISTFNKDIFKEAPTNKEKFKERTIVESLRLGIVPYKYIEDFIFGREKEIKTIEKWLKGEDKRKILVINGEYGSGKTHLASYIESLALKLNYVTSFVELDYYEAPFYRPKRIYRNIVSSLKYIKGDNKYDFRDLLRSIIRKLGGWKDHHFFKHIDPIKEDENIWEWIEAKNINSCKPYEPAYNSLGKEYNKYYFLPPLYDEFTSLNVYFNLISSIAWGITKILKMEGFLIIFDETESISIGSKSQYEKNKNFIDTLFLLIKNDRRLLDKKVSKNELPLEFSKRSSKISWIPYMYRSDFNLMVVFTSTNQEFYFDNSISINIEKLSKKDLQNIFDAVYKNYAKAYGIEIEPYIRNKIFNILIEKDKPLRLFIKGAVEACDLCRLNKEIFTKRHEIRQIGRN